MEQSTFAMYVVFYFSRRELKTLRPMIRRAWKQETASRGKIRWTSLFIKNKLLLFSKNYMLGRQLPALKARAYNCTRAIRYAAIARSIGH
jgi:hypothetical protein